MNGEIRPMGKVHEDSYNIGEMQYGTDITVNRPIVTPATHKESEIRHTADFHDESNFIDTEEYVDDNLSLVESEFALIKKALDKHEGKRKAAAKELGISERTLYRKLKEYSFSK